MTQFYEIIYNMMSSEPFFSLSVLLSNYGLQESDFCFFVLIVTFILFILMLYIPLKVILKLKNKFERII